MLIWTCEDIDLENFSPHDEALCTWGIIYDHGKLGAMEKYLLKEYPLGITAPELNRLLTFHGSRLLQILGINTEET